MRNLVLFKTLLIFAFENAARYPNSETNLQCCVDRPMSSPSLVKLGPRTPEKAVSVVPHPANCWRKSAKSPITQPWIIRFRLNFVQSLNT